MFVEDNDNGSYGELKDITMMVFARGAHYGWYSCKCKVSTGLLRNKAAAVDPQLTNVSAKSKSATHQYGLEQL